MQIKEIQDSELDSITEFQDFVGTKSIAVVDPIGPSRANILKALTSLNIPISNIYSFRDYASAWEAFLEMTDEKIPILLFLEYNLNGKSGLELIQNLKELNAKFASVIYFIVTSSANEVGVLQAAEDEVDSYILKPFSIDALKERILKIALSKKSPTPYQLALDAGKKHFQNNLFEESIKSLQMALEKNPKPTLACAYIGKAYYAIGDSIKAKKWFLQGLRYNKNSLQCLSGLCDIFCEEEIFDKSYQIIQRLTSFFPLTPKRLKQALNLAIRLDKYDDILKHYDNYLLLDYRDPELKEIITAGLIISAKRYFQYKKIDLGKQTISKVGNLAQDNPKTLRKIIELLCEFGQEVLAGKYLVRFSDSSKNSADYHAMRVLILKRNISDDDFIREIRMVLASGKKDPILYKCLIQVFCKYKRFNSAEDAMYDALSVFPAQKEYFLKLMEHCKNDN